MSDEKKFEPTQEDFGEPKKGSKALVLLLAIVVIIVAVVAVYMVRMNCPRYVFDKKIDAYLNSEKVNQDYRTMKVNADLTVSVESDDEATKQIADLINDAKLSMNAELERETQNEIVSLKLSKADEELLNIDAKMDTEAQSVYMNLGDLFDKTIEIKDSEMTNTSITTIGQKITYKKATGILRKAIKTQLKDEYFSAEKTTVNDENVTKNTMRLSGEQFATVIRNVCENLSNNEEFLDCFEDRDDVKDSLQEIVVELEDMDTFEEDDYIVIAVYTKGLMKNIARVDLSIESDEDIATIALTKVNDNEYSYEIYVNDEKNLDGKINYTKNDKEFSGEISANVEGTEVSMKLAGNYVYDEDLRDFDTSNTVSYEEMTTEDIYTIVGNFMGSKLYEIVAGFSGNTSLFNSGLEEEDNNSSNEMGSSLSNQNATTADNVIKTYDDKKEIEFSIPDGFKADDSESGYYKTFKKDVDEETIKVDVSSESSETVKGYFEDVKEMTEYYEEDDDYKNVQVSDVKEITVAGNIFKKVNFTYDYVMDEDEVHSYSDAYIAYEIDGDNLYTVEIDNDHLLSESELEKFLTITVK